MLPSSSADESGSGPFFFLSFSFGPVLFRLMAFFLLLFDYCDGWFWVFFLKLRWEFTPGSLIAVL